jgi:hypothetical protein
MVLLNFCLEWHSPGTYSIVINVCVHLSRLLSMCVALLLCCSSGTFRRIFCSGFPKSQLMSIDTQVIGHACGSFSMPAGARPHGGFVALLVVGPTSHHSLKEFTDTAGGHHCWERTLLISKEQLQAGFATELKEPCLFATDRQQPPSPGCLCIFGGKVLLADLPAGVDFDILHRTDALQLAREACKQALV